jgi:multisubunit Na+/H+ antiporter MnhB subunit
LQGRKRSLAATGRKIAWVLSLALLLFTGVVGIYNTITEWDPSRTPVQKSVTAGVFLYGVIGLAAAYGLFRRRRWCVATAIAWAVAVTYAPGVAVMAFGGEDAMMSSAIAASAGSALIALGVVWTAYAMTRRDAQVVSSDR